MSLYLALLRRKECHFALLYSEGNSAPLPCFTQKERVSLGLLYSEGNSAPLPCFTQKERVSLCLALITCNNAHLPVTQNVIISFTFYQAIASITLY